MDEVYGYSKERMGEVEEKPVKKVKETIKKVVVKKGKSKRK